MIRQTINDDHSAIMEIAIDSGLFEQGQTELLRGMLECPDEDDIWFTHVQEGIPVGVAYLAPEKMTNGTWNLYWIAVHPRHQKQGLGKAMLSHIQSWLMKKNQRILIVETAGLDQFNYVRKFYSDNGFSLEARIREFYETGIDKVVFWKSLSNLD